MKWYFDRLRQSRAVLWGDIRSDGKAEMRSSLFKVTS
jgi:hypothetical protein